MAKPTQDVKWSDNANYGGGGATKIEPSSGQKDAGWAVGQKPPAQWLNWWQNSVAAWVQWLKDYEDTNHVWTQSQTLLKALVVADGDGTHTAIRGLAGNTANDVGTQGEAGNGANSYGTAGIGKAVAAQGSHGTKGIGGAGTGSGAIGGRGLLGLGGAGGSGAGVGGVGADLTGGAIDGTTNTTGKAGAALKATGGAITADANARRGGSAIEATGGAGALDYGYALHSDHGSIVLEDGGVFTPVDKASGFGTGTQISGNASITGTLTVGTIGTLEAKTALALVPAWGNLGGGYAAAAAWKDKQGIVNLEGDVFGGATGTLITTLPVGYRPAFAQSFPGRGDAVNNKAALISVFANGDVVAAFATGHAGNVSLSGIRFRTD